MRKSVSTIWFALLLSAFSTALAADQKPSTDSTGDFDKTVPSQRKLTLSPTKIRKMELYEFLKHAKILIQKHQYEKAIRILNHRLESEPANDHIIAALVSAHKEFADDLCLHKEFEKATTEYKAALSLLSI